ncbi:MAG: DNA polymerase/3'-5' exonuclease PolX [Planctomycetota bacterium]|nr:MAG: DNA polymerase/3'-5' exonuclease PolX [Planctomycetota bacterium]
MTNAEIAHVFDEMADLLELRGENAFRVRAYRNAARAIAQLPEPVEEILRDGTRDLQAVAGIGQTIAEKTRTLVQTGSLPQLEKLRAETPPVLLQMTRIPGVGPKKALVLHRELGIESLADLRQACLDHRVQKLKGFGAKTEEAILAGLEIAEAASRRLRIDQAEELVERLQQHMHECPAVQRLEFAGSFRRGKETVGDIDMLVTSEDPASVMDRLGEFPALSGVIARGETKMSIRVEDQFQVDLRVVAAESFGAAWQYFTGSKEHNVQVRSRARRRGLTVNEYGVFRIDAPEDRVAGSTEEEVYQSLGLAWIPPELREGRQELQWYEDPAQMPRLVELKDIRGDLHMHSTATDGLHTVAQMAQAAVERGLSYIAITDHSQRVRMAGGLDEQRLLEHWEHIDRVAAQFQGRLAILKGIECDILESGQLDLSDEVLAQADWVLASVHYGQRQPGDQITRRIVGALQNPHVDAIAHPTGRLLGSRPPYDVDMETVLETAVECRKILELNANPKRLDLSEQHLLRAVALGIPITINTDAHSTEGLQVMRYGVIQARRAGVPRDQVVNTWSLDRLREWLQR